jgi:gluconokinase
MLLIVFGMLGSGKNYIGEILSEDYGMTFYDADTDLPPAMREAIRKREFVPDAARDHFFDIVVERLKELKQKSPDLVCAQALYKEKHRGLIQRAFPEAQFILVESTLELVMERLAHRQDGFVDADYARKIAPLFEAPQLAHAVIVNVAGRAEVKQQIDQILAAIAASNSEQGA